jgi:hypothetical protein
MKKFVKKFNNLVKKTIFKVENKTNNKFIISSFNKYLIILISFLFIYLFYLLIPLLYTKDWIQNNIESKIFNEFKINVSASADISYRILPSPHFLIKNSKILMDSSTSQKNIAEVKNLKVFINQKNFFDKELIDLTKLTIDNANFFLLRNELKILNDFSNNQFSSKKIKINNSNIFFKDNLGEIITIIKIDKSILFFDSEKQLNLFDLKGNVFGFKFKFDFESKNDSSINRKINLKAKSLKLDIINESIFENDSFKNGYNVISFLNSLIKTKYDVKEKVIIFESDNSRLNSSKIYYKGELSINPFDLNLNIDLGKYKISQLFSFNHIIKEFIKTGLLFNENLSLDISLIAKTNTLDKFFESVKINFNIINGKLNLDNTKFVNDKIGLMELSNSSLFLKNNELILNTDILFTIKDTKPLFSLLNTSKNSRKEIKNILVNLNYDFLANEIDFNKVKIDNTEVSDQFLNVLEGFIDNEKNNPIKSKLLLNKLLNIYAG